MSALKMLSDILNTITRIPDIPDIPEKVTVIPEYSFGSDFEFLLIAVVLLIATIARYMIDMRIQCGIVHRLNTELASVIAKNAELIKIVHDIEIQIKIFQDAVFEQSDAIEKTINQKRYRTKTSNASNAFKTFKTFKTSPNVAKKTSTSASNTCDEDTTEGIARERKNLFEDNLFNNKSPPEWVM